MGGGGAMRAAVAKAAAVGGVINSGFRAHLPESPFSAATRMVGRPVSPISATSSADTAKAAVAIDQPSLQKPAWGIDEWEFAGCEEELVVGSGEYRPRLVFGSAPTLQEAKEATSELKDALEKVYLSSPTSPRHGLDSGSYQLTCSEVLQTKACVTTETAVAPAMPTHAIQAFKFLNESPAVQTVVASIASDANVWNAVLLNPALQDYLQSQKIEESSESSVDGDDWKSPRSVEALSETGESNFRNRLKDTLQNVKHTWQNVKHTVIDMMTDLSDYFQTLFGGQPANKVPADTNTSNSFIEKVLGPSVMGLVVMVIMVVVLRRR